MLKFGKSAAYWHKYCHLGFSSKIEMPQLGSAHNLYSSEQLGKFQLKLITTVDTICTKLNLGKVADHTTINAQPHTRLISVLKPSNWKTMAHSIGNFPIWITMHGMRKWYNSMHFWLYQILGMIYLLTIFRKLRKKK